MMSVGAEATPPPKATPGYPLLTAKTPSLLTAFMLCFAIDGEDAVVTISV